MNFIQVIMLVILGLATAETGEATTQLGKDCVERKITRDFILGDNIYEPTCVGFTAGEGTYGTGLCEYCEQQLGTTEYSFLNGVHPAPEGCSTLPIPGRQYVCCSN